MTFSDSRLASVFKALADPNRLRILRLLRNGEKCACELLGGMEITQSTLSHHMATLCEGGVVSSRQDGKWIFYSIDPEIGSALNATLAKIIFAPAKRNAKRSPACA